MNILVSSFVLCSAKEKALLEIVMHKITKNGEYKTEVEKLIGNFSSAGSTVSAEGDILQVSHVPVLYQCIAPFLISPGVYFGMLLISRRNVIFTSEVVYYLLSG